MEISDRQRKLIKHLLSREGKHKYEDTLTDLTESLNYYKSVNVITYELRSLDINFMMWLKRKVQPLDYNANTIDAMLQPLLKDLLLQERSRESRVEKEQVQTPSPT